MPPPEVVFWVLIFAFGGLSESEMICNIQWGDLPTELLQKIAISYPGLQNLIRGVCKSWKTGLEANCTQLKISETALPPDLGVRFSSLAKLDLYFCMPDVTPRGLRALRALPSLSSLRLKFTEGQHTMEFLGALRGLSLKVLALELAAADITDASVAALRALNLSRVDLLLPEEHGDFSDVHLRRLAGRDFLLYLLGRGQSDMRRWCFCRT